MASLRTLPNSPFWIACFTLLNGARTQRSTRVPIGGVKKLDFAPLKKMLADLLGSEITLPASAETDVALTARDAKRLAQQIADKFEDTARMARQSRLVESQARKVIADIFTLATADKLPSATVADFLTSWLKRKEIETSDSTSMRYRVVVDRFAVFLGQRAKLNLGSVTVKDIADFRDDLTKQVATGTANLYLKSLRVAFGQAVKDGLLDINPAARVSILKQRGGNKRRAFTLPELKRLLDASDDTWRGLILLGFYTGQRLSDLANLTWANVDLAREELRFVTKKTSRQMILPITAPLLRYLETLPASDTPDAPLFPAVYNRPVSTLSNAFTRLMASAGLAKADEHRSKGKGRDVRRQLNQIGFHALRHTSTSLLKAAGVGEAVAMELIGHDSPAISAHYTHVDSETLRRAANKLPDLTK